MKLMLAATSIALILTSAGFGEPAQAQAPVPAKPKAAATTPPRPALPTPTNTAIAMTPADRLALQSDLAWAGQYNGAITGEVSARMVAAIKAFQKARGGKETGALNPQERGALADTAKRSRESVGWKIVTDAGSGAQLGIPGGLVPQQSSDTNGTRWSAPDGTIQVVLAHRKEAGATTDKLAEREKKEPAGRTVDYTVVKPDFFVLSGMQDLKKFYVRGTFKGDEVRILTILYDPATENTVGPVVIAMSSAFNPFPSSAVATTPAPRRPVEYGTGIVASADGAILTDRQITDGCLAITIAGLGNADRVADDKQHDLALLRIYGAHGLNPLSIVTGATTSAVDITGIADPQNQGGAAAISNLKAQATPVGGSADLALSPPPGLGFSGAAVRGADGKFAGIALLKPPVVAGPPTTAPAAQAVLVPPETVRAFFKANGVDAAGTSTDARASVVRVICVRK
jgi:peptidoglycan hydrolase-like protein with peptidoglycan-binding domain